MNSTATLAPAGTKCSPKGFECGTNKDAVHLGPGAA